MLPVDIQVLGESQNDVDKLENYLKMYIMQGNQGSISCSSINSEH